MWRRGEVTGSPVRYTTFSKYIDQLADAVNLQDLLDQLADFLLQSGFAGGAGDRLWGDGDAGDADGDRSLEGLREAILEALKGSGLLTPDMLKVLRGESTGDAARDAELERQLAELLDAIVQRLIEQGYLSVSEAPRMPGGQELVEGTEGQARSAAQQVHFNLTEKGVDFLGYRALRNLLGSIGRSSYGSHDTPYLATGVEADAASRPYEYGDTMNLDVIATLLSAIEREGLGVPLDLEYGDLMVPEPTGRCKRSPGNWPELLRGRCSRKRVWCW